MIAFLLVFAAAFPLCIVLSHHFLSLSLADVPSLSPLLSALLFVCPSVSHPLCASSCHFTYSLTLCLCEVLHLLTHCLITILHTQ